MELYPRSRHTRPVLALKSMISIYHPALCPSFFDSPKCSVYAGLPYQGPTRTRGMHQEAKKIAHLHHAVLLRPSAATLFSLQCLC